MKAITRQDLGAALILLILPLLLFWPVTLGSKTLLPADNLFAFEPWASYKAELGVGFPQNQLLSDLILENYVWKKFIRESIAARQIPIRHLRNSIRFHLPAVLAGLDAIPVTE